MFSRQRPVAIANDWNTNYQTIGYGNYGYGLYVQDIELMPNPFSRGLHVERDIDYIPLGNSGFGAYAGIPAIIHQHYPF
jgi:hypothetical protein